MLKLEVNHLIVYDKLWNTMKEKHISQYQLIKRYGFSTGQLDRLRKNGNINSYTLNELCKILDCRLEDIAEYRKEEEAESV
jgi:putative transcriptional regulator